MKIASFETIILVLTSYAMASQFTSDYLYIEKFPPKTI